MIRQPAKLLKLIACSFLLVACGGGGGDTNGGGTSVLPPPPPPPPPPAVSSIELTSDAGDFIGQGQSFSYSKADSELSVSIFVGLLSISVEGDEAWRGEFQLPEANSGRLEVGTYSNLMRYPYHDPAVGGMNWLGAGRRCNFLTGTFTVNEVTYDNSELVAFELSFEQFCDGSSSALRGEVVWDANDVVMPPGPAVPIPTGIWEPAPGTVPDTGSFVYLESSPGDSVGQGADHLYTLTDSALTVNTANGRLSVGVNGTEYWIGDFQAMNVISFVEAGYYGDLQRYPLHNAVKGGLSWAGDRRTCNRLTGWFAVDSVTYLGNNLTSIELRFEQRCDGGPPLHGAIRWDANDTTLPPGPQSSPSDLWTPAQGATPDSGSYVYLESDAGDWIGQGGTYQYTQPDSILTVHGNGPTLYVSISGNESWTGDFVGMVSLNRLEPGFYGDLQRFPFHDPAKGGLNWSGEGRECGTLTGWFNVDSVTYDAVRLRSIELRFEQHCEGNDAALNGEIHWQYGNSIARRPVLPPPPGLWDAPLDATPATGNYVYLESDPRDYVGFGQTYLYTSGDSLFEVTNDEPARFKLRVTGDERWSGDFKGMNTLSQLEVGYYGDLQRFPGSSPDGGLSWSGEGRACNQLAGWFVVDSITYDGDNISAIDLRFAQHCEQDEAALFGKIHWDANNTIASPGPVVPPPAGLWEPAPGTTPANGNYVYLESTFGDWVGQGENYVYTPADAGFDVTLAGPTLTVSVNGVEWAGIFQGMDSLSQLESGFYGDLQRTPVHNPVKGGLSWFGQGRGCGRVAGWFIVDHIAYDGSTLTAIDLRFAQHCDGGPPLNGEIHWDTNDQ